MNRDKVPILPYRPLLQRGQTATATRVAVPGREVTILVANLFFPHGLSHTGTLEQPTLPPRSEPCKESSTNWDLVFTFIRIRHVLARDVVTPALRGRAGRDVP